MQNAEWVNAIDRQRMYSAELAEYYQFLNNSSIYASFKTGEENFSVNDGKRWLKFNFPPDVVKQFFNIVEKCRKVKSESLIMCILERQAPCSGLYIDFDIETKDSNISFDEKELIKIGRFILNYVKQSTVITETTKVNLFFAVKPAIVKKSESLWKYGIHIICPNILIEKPFKQWLYQRMSEDTKIAEIMKKHNVENFDKVFDTNSANVPPVLFGVCSKQNMFKPYVLSCAYEYVIDTDPNEPIDCVKISQEELDKRNLVAELALSNETEPPLLPRRTFTPKPEIVTELEKQPKQNDLFVDDSFKWDPEHEIVKSLLDLLPEKYYEDRNLWRNVIFALANTKKELKQLAIEFSKKSKSKWDPDAFDDLWNYALEHTVERPLTIRSIEFWARENNRLLYENVMKNNSRVLLRNYIFNSFGKLTHNHIAQLLSKIFSTRFVTDVDQSMLKDGYQWYEFVTSEEKKEKGEIWKWRSTILPERINFYISDQLISQVEEVGREINNELIERTAELSELEIKTKKQIVKNLDKIKSDLGSHVFKVNVLKESEPYFHQYGFLSRLDKDGSLMGVGNGVLILSDHCTLIDNPHEHCISKYSSIPFIPFDQQNEKTKKVLKAIEDIIFESDAREWIMMFFAQCLDGFQKEGLILLWEGSGQNGKTTLIQWVAKCLGQYASKLVMTLLTSDYETADKPNSAAMKIKGLRFGYFEESRRGDKLNEARLKELANPGSITARDLHKKQEMFPVTCNTVATSQYPFIIDATDHGTWRRIRHYKSKIQFKKDPDPNKPYEKQEDQNLIRKDDPDFLASFLSVLVHYYEQLQTKYGGEMKNVPCPTISHETEEFRISRDSIHRYICHNIFKSPLERKYSMSYLVKEYIAWYIMNVDKAPPKVATIEQEFRNSILSSYLSPLPSGDYELVGCRIKVSDKDSGTTQVLGEGEEYLSGYTKSGVIEKRIMYFDLPELDCETNVYCYFNKVEYHE